MLATAFAHAPAALTTTLVLMRCPPSVTHAVTCDSCAPVAVVRCSVSIAASPCFSHTRAPSVRAARAYWLTTPVGSMVPSPGE